MERDYGTWNLNSETCNEIMGSWNVIRGPWNVIMGKLNVNRGR